jgi:hypothetical protein
MDKAGVSCELRSALKPVGGSGDQRGEAVTRPWQRGRACARSDPGTPLSDRCN